MTSRMPKTDATPMIQTTQPMLQSIATAGNSVGAPRAFVGIAGRVPLRATNARRSSPMSNNPSEPMDGFSSKSKGASAQTCALVMLLLLFCAVLMSGSAAHQPTSRDSHGLSILVEP